MLPQDRKDFIDAHFHENIAEQDLSREVFEQLRTPQELAYLAERHNWDNGVQRMLWIAQSPLCSRATAAEIFWLSQPQEYQQYKLGQKLKSAEKAQVFTLIQTVLQRFPQDYVAAADLHFDPVPMLQNSLDIPAALYQPTPGDPSYVYYTSDDVSHWFAQDWLIQIEQASSAIELFNIAWFMHEPEQARAILAHPLCDLGIATLVFWRLYSRCSLDVTTPALLRDLLHNIDSGSYAPTIAYVPAEDDAIELPKAAKWHIPPALKQAV